MDVEEGIRTWLKSTSMNKEEVDTMMLVNIGETFAERAEWYYHKRPQLLALLQDLHNRLQLLNKNDQQQHQQGQEREQPVTVVYPIQSQNGILLDEIVADLVIKNVEKDILEDQAREVEQQNVAFTSRRKIELLKKLVEVLESERQVLLNENMKLECKLTGALQENRGLASEVMFLKRRIGELGRCCGVLKMSEDSRRACVLSRKVEDLQRQIYGLEKYYYFNQLHRHLDDHAKEEESKKVVEHGHSQQRQKAVELGCFQLFEKVKQNVVSNSKTGGAPGTAKRVVVKWWEKVKSTDLLMCGVQQNQHQPCS